MAERSPIGPHEIFAIVRRRWALILLPILVAGTVAVVMTSRVDPKYRARAVVLVQDLTAQQDLAGLVPTQNAFVLLQAEAAFASSDEVRRLAFTEGRQPLSVDVQYDGVSTTQFVTGVNPSLMFVATDTDPEWAAMHANAYASAYLAARADAQVEAMTAATVAITNRIAAIDEERDDLLGTVGPDEDQSAIAGQLAALEAEEANLRSSLRAMQLSDQLSMLNGARLSVEATPPAEPYEPNLTRNVAVAMLLGALVGLGAALLRESLDSTIRTKNDVERLTGLPVLGVLPQLRPKRLGRRRGPVSVGLMPSAGHYAEAVRSLRASVEFSIAGIDECRSIAVTSANAGEGKSTVALNLTYAMSRRRQEVILVDADLRRPTVARLTRVSETAPGMGEILESRVGITTCTEQVTGSEAFSVLPAGRPTSDPSELLAGDGLVDVLDFVERKFDLVVLDTAPLLPVSDAMAVCGAADATLLVVQADATDATQLDAALEFLERANAKVIGVVLNREVDTRSSRYGRYGYGAAGRLGDST